VNDKPFAPARAGVLTTPAADGFKVLETRAADDVGRARAAQVVSSVLDAMGTAKEIRRRTETDRPTA
jgi:hypothetical protein